MTLVVEHTTRSESKRKETLEIGPGLEEGVRVGPLVNEAARHKIDSPMADALDRGARVLTGAIDRRARVASTGRLLSSGSSRVRRSGGRRSSARSLRS